ncbi:MAG TPA: hypothetical protein EYN91_24565, partial [Candidatus Melainabacteria bacterium]|nr:hypothetical protein [Candidatus Melainabacteria bacterium]
MSLPTKSSFFLTIAALALLSPAGHAMPANDIKPPPLNEKDFGNRVGIDFSKTSAYKEETDKSIADAYAACKKYLSEKEKGAAKGLPAVVSDLDETLIDNRPHFEKTPEFNWPAFEAWIKKADAPLLPKTAAFLQWARKNGFAIFFITGRREGLRADTINNLIKREVAYDGLLMRKDGDKGSAEAVKVPLREQVEKMGFTIVV